MSKVRAAAIGKCLLLERDDVSFVVRRITHKLHGLRRGVARLGERDNDVLHRVRQLANQYGTTFEKMKAELDEKRAIGQVREEVLIGKVLDFLTSNANIEVSSKRPVNS